MDHIQPRDGPHSEHLPLGQKHFVHGSDAPLRLGPSGHRSMTSRSNDIPSSSHPIQFPGHRVGNRETSHVSFVPFSTGRSSGHVPHSSQPKPAPSHTLRSEECFADVSSHVALLDNRRVAMKRKAHPVNGMNAADYYMGSSSSSNTRFSNYVQQNPTALSEPSHHQMPLSIGPSNWNGQSLVNQEGPQRNVRARHNPEPRPASTSTAVNNNPPTFGSTGSAFTSTSAGRNQAPFSLPTRTLPSGASGVTGTVSSSRPYHPAMHSSSSSVAAAPTVQGSSGGAIFANAGYAHPSSAASSSSRAISHAAVIPSYHPATSSSMRINQPSPIGTAASSTHARHVSMGHANSGRNQRARSSMYGINPSMVEAQRFMMEQLALYQSRQPPPVDPHRDLRLNIDEMSYEDLLVLEESIGNVNTGLEDEKISSCVKKVVCCCSDERQDDEDDDGSCVVCLEGYRDKDVLGVLKCRHDFHADCIEKWLQEKNACPVCKLVAA